MPKSFHKGRRDVYLSLEDAVASIPRRFWSSPSGEPSWRGWGDRDELESLALNGWQDEAPEALAIAEEAIGSVEAQVEIASFAIEHDVMGGSVDVGAYLSGVPECMVQYVPVSVPRPGRVITLCASVCYSSRYTTDQIARRGMGVVALALALQRLGLQVEIWADATNGTREGSCQGGTRVLLKGANDETDVARLMFGLAHPAMLRGIVFGSWKGWATKESKDATGSDDPAFAYPCDPWEDLPEGTIYLPAVRANRPESECFEPADMLRVQLERLGVA